MQIETYTIISIILHFISVANLLLCQYGFHVILTILVRVQFCSVFVIAVLLFQRRKLATI
jgi:hypothetical protein